MYDSSSLLPTCKISRSTFLLLYVWWQFLIINGATIIQGNNNVIYKRIFERCEKNFYLWVKGFVSSKEFGNLFKLHCRQFHWPPKSVQQNIKSIQRKAKNKKDPSILAPKEINWWFNQFTNFCSVTTKLTKF